jgi:hypothetical protein
MTFFRHLSLGMVALLCWSGGHATASLGIAPKPWTEADVARFLAKTEDDIRLLRHRLEYAPRRDKRVLGTCFEGRKARFLVRKDDLVRSLGAWITGPALQCYVASYFGCTIGDDVGVAGLANFDGPLLQAYDGSKVIIVEQTRDRIVAEVAEASDPEQDLTDMRSHSRFTLVRDAAGVWRIWDRQTTQEWECRVR